MDDEFLAEIADNPDDEATRLVYQDWLEDHGDQRAEYLRLQSELTQLPTDAPNRERVRHKLGELRGTLLKSWRDWLIMISRSRIENCSRPAEHHESGEHEGPTFEFECPKQWSRLQAVDDLADPTIRFCDQCEKHVFFCDDVDEAEQLADWGQCIALDESLVRKERVVIKGDSMLMGLLVVPKRLAKVGARFRDMEGE